MHDILTRGILQACAKMMALKDGCLSRDSQHPYIQSISGGRDNSKEGLQVR